MLRLLPILLFFVSTAFAQTFTSTIRGSVRDSDTGLPLTGATVSLSPTQAGAITDAQGTFRFGNLSVGRYQLTVSYLGYTTVLISELLLESGKENVQQIRLLPSGKQLHEATVTATRPVSVNSIQEITIEQTFRYAATYMDPARVATSFPGVAAANDQANGLVIRGNSPNSMQWRLEGVEIVNPNHLSNAGTFSDRPTSTGGGVNILSTQLLGTSQFLSGAFPAQYGNVNGGILDMHLRNGNDEQTEFTAQASLLGLDFAAEGPFSKKSKAFYLVNYRYSFTALLGAMGASFGGEDMRFQDLSFNLNFPNAKGGRFTVFGTGGISSNTFEPDKDTAAWEYEKDGQNILYKNRMFASGITFEQPLANKLSVRAALVGSALATSRVAYAVNSQSFGRDELLGDQKLINGKVSLNTTFTYRYNPRSRFEWGLFVTLNKYETDVWSVNTNLNSLAVQPFVKWSFQVTPGISGEVGLHAMLSKVERTEKLSALPEPRAAVKWQLSETDQLSASYGLHSQMQTAGLYTTHIYDTDYYNNRNLSPTRSQQIVLGYQKSFPKNSSLKIEAYWQHLFDVPVGQGLRDNYSVVNLIEEIPYEFLKNNGTARNYGVEASFQKLLTSDYYLLVSGSLYDATYVDLFGQRHKARFNGRHTFSFTGGKEFKSGNESLWGVNAKVLWLGGFRDKPIDVEYSKVLKTTLYEAQSHYSVKMKDYFRPDLRIYWKKSKAKFNRTLAIDLQNVSGTKNEAYRYFDKRKDDVVTQYQLGLIPVLSYRWEF
ncbi:TonB-dependent receptor [Dyadobacter sp. LJ53]|uniref:TonB-dependent receptor n=1 Tax=Dyadobacter chenwenxiniae TaxID=2906456 RepID=UPI001F168795|nr:TonB-dependent receptor [Dyadobacter chenwenxiniae]MCF0052703.1 TonB-dependent receptor [Dyadobacter chenwenxiniae]